MTTNLVAFLQNARSPWKLLKSSSRLFEKIKSSKQCAEFFLE